MSFILNALRKSESQRRLGEPPRPGMSVPGRSPTPARRRRRIGWMVILLLLAISVAYLFDLPQRMIGLFQDGGASQTAGQSPDPGPPTERPDAHPPVTDRQTALPPQGVPEPGPKPGSVAGRGAGPGGNSDSGSGPSEGGSPAVMAPADRPAGAELADAAGPTQAASAATLDSPESSAAVPADRGQVAEREQLPEAPAAIAREPEPPQTHESLTRTPPPSQPRPAEITPQPVALPGDRVPHKLELPLATRQSLPDLELNVHVYDPDPAKRFVLINMVRYQEGDIVGDAVYLEEIDANGVELKYRTTRFRLSNN